MSINEPQRILWIIDTLPLSSEKAREDLDFIFMLAAFEIKMTLLFIHEGVFQLLDTDHLRIQQRAFTPLLKAYQDYEIENIYVLQESLTQFNLSTQDFTLPISCLHEKDIPQLGQKMNYIIR
jgi:tRNA 2-thiouridine synthesizing protein C